MKITLGKNSKGEWTIIHSPDAPVSDHLQAFEEANLKALPKGVVEVWQGDIERYRHTVGPKGGLLEQEAAKKRAEEKAKIQNRLDEENAARLARVNPEAAAAEIDRLKGKKPAEPAKK
jgi:hypothetical protein